MLLDQPWVKSLLTNHALWRGEFVDLWSIDHILAGVGLAYLFYVFVLSEREATVETERWWKAGIIASMVLGAMWEIFEKVTTLSKTEAYTNSMTDIFLTPVGFALGFYLFRKSPKAWQRIVILISFGASYLVILYLGFAGFRYYGR